MANKLKRTCVFCGSERDPREEMVTIAFTQQIKVKGQIVEASTRTIWQACLTCMVNSINFPGGPVSMSRDDDPVASWGTYGQHLLIK